MGQRGNSHCHPLALLSLRWAGGGEADADHFVDWSKQAKLRETLKVSAGREEGGDARGRGYYLEVTEQLYSHVSAIGFQFSQCREGNF